MRDGPFEAAQETRRDRFAPLPATENGMAGERLLTVADVCGLIQVAATFVYRHAAELGAMKVGSHLRFRLRDVEAWLDSQRMADASDCPTPVDNGLLSDKRRVSRKKR